MQKSDQVDAKKIGVIVPCDGASPYEIIDDSFVCNWLTEHSLDDVEYISFHTPDDSLASGLEYCERLATEEVLSAAAHELGKQRCQSVVWGCTSASFFKGVRYAQRQVQLLSESAAAPASSTSMAFLAALDVLGAKEVDVVLPYSPEVAKKLVSFFSEAGISVRNVWHMRHRVSDRVFEIDCEADLAEFVSSSPFSDSPILIPCTGISTLNRVERFEKISGRPVITANQVTLWHALVLAGVTPDVLDAGSFLRSFAQKGGERLRLPLEL